MQDQHLLEIEDQCVLESSFLEKIEKFLQNAVFSATMLGNLINDMLDLAKFESGTFKFHNEYFDLIEIIEQAFETIRYQAEKKEIKMAYKVLDHRNEPLEKKQSSTNPADSNKSQSLPNASLSSLSKDSISLKGNIG